MTSRRFDSEPRAIARLQRKVAELSRRASRIGHTHAPDLVRGYDLDASSSAIGGTATTFTSVDLTIPADWNTYDLEAWSEAQLIDASGSSTGSGVIVARHKVDGVEFGNLIANEVPGSNDDDNNLMVWMNWVTGETTTGVITVTGTLELASGNATSASRSRAIVHAYRTS